MEDHLLTRQSLAMKLKEHRQQHHSVSTPVMPRALCHV
jgi:hypothetical protein